MKRLWQKIDGPLIQNSGTVANLISQPFDQLRQQAADLFSAEYLDKGPLAFFRSQEKVIPYLANLYLKNYSLEQHPSLVALRVARHSDQYPQVRVFNFAYSQAPQI